jgi:hypothetical protein
MRLRSAYGLVAPIRLDWPKSRSTSRTWRMVVLSAGIRSLLRKAEGADLSRPAEAPDRARSSRNGGRHHLGTTGGFTWNRHSFLDRVGFARSIMSLQELDPSVNGSLCSIDLLFGKRLKLK